MSRTLLTGTILRSGSIPTSALGGGVVSSSAQITTALPEGTVSSSAQVAALIPAGTVSSSNQVDITATTNYTTFSSSIATKNDLQDITISSLNAATSSYAINATIQGQLAGVVSSSTQVKPLLPGGTVSSSAQVVAGITSQTIAPTTVNATNITASALTVNQAVFTNASDGLVSNAITGTGNVVMSASPTLTGTITADKMVMSGSQFAGIVSGSGTQYRFVVPVGTNLYAT